MGENVHSELLAGYPVVVELPVAWGEMDFYRHVNNTVYFRYFESARLEYFRRLGWFEYEEQTGVGPILQAASARFHGGGLFIQAAGQVVPFPPHVLAGQGEELPRPRRAGRAERLDQPLDHGPEQL